MKTFSIIILFGLYNIAIAQAPKMIVETKQGNQEYNLEDIIAITFSTTDVTDYPITDLVWEGNWWSMNIDQGYWFPTFNENLSNFSIDDYSWGQIHTINEIPLGTCFQFEVQLKLSSGGVNTDAAFFGFGDQWASYAGNAAGICFIEGYIKVFETINGTYSFKETIGTYNTNENLTFTLSTDTKGSLYYSVKGVNNTFTPSFTFTKVKPIITCANSNDGFNVISVKGW